MVNAGFRGKVALITGATHGIGQATAVKLAADGAIVACNHRPTSCPDEIMKMVADTGGTGFPVAADMSDPAQITAMIAETVRQAGRLDYIVSNAAINPFMTWDQTSLEAYDLLMNTNLRGTWVICTEGAKEMIREGHGGAIVTISSISAYVGAPGQTAYCGTKGGILAMSKALARDLGKHQIRVNCILPGCIMTNLSRDLLLSGGEALRFYEEKTPLGRIGAASEIASAVSFFLSDDASFITSAELLIDGGFIVNAEFDGGTDVISEANVECLSGK